ncbi:uncharacterized protein MELLADRAFT_111150 [Melampsora larici-populina 98AG31]|uniref:Uncharacterized protein n=1 Tax=Melampsora larici-populina (strain 98AG31 / pathotype 3-4-7) TaxID=747676 RepID=F4S269_MELLP|nr:uncharacterized protein MELLADRAFT_111150 [Melampsora larici-populina 98AG31]EGG01305.1 hypothetical protein MELLADRAFT_111150 [Melampsora larici-populina 98AG31]
MHFQKMNGHLDSTQLTYLIFILIYSELCDHQHKSATPYGSLHAPHTFNQSSQPEKFEESIPVHNTQHVPRPTEPSRFAEPTPILSYANIIPRESKLLLMHNPVLTSYYITFYNHQYVILKGPIKNQLNRQRLRNPNGYEKTAGSHVPIEDLPEQIKLSVGRLEATELCILE